METEYGVHSLFDIEKHKEVYPYDYLEVIITSDGTIQYATPSHTEKTTALACTKLGVTRDELACMCPREYHADYITWLCMVSETVSVWEKFCVAPNPTINQINTLKRLKMAGLYKGRIPKL